MFKNTSPFIPLPLQRGEGRVYLKGAKPLSILLFSITLVFLTYPFSVKAQTLTIDEVASSLVCQCGCQSVLSNCTHIECGSAVPMKAAIKEMIGKGMAKDQIILAFVQNYGEQVLAAPTKKGFNLTAWITPFVALVVGAVALFFILREWVRRSKQEYAESSVSAVSDQADPYKRRLEEELRNWKA